MKRLHSKPMLRLAVVFCLITTVIGLALPTAQAEESPTQLHITQTLYRTLKADETYVLNADIYIDGQLALAAIPYPFTTDYLPLTPEKHTVTLVMTGEDPKTGISTEIAVVAGHSYHLIALGDVAEGSKPPLIVQIDETSTLAENSLTESAAATILVNLLEIPVDVYFGDKLVAPALEMGKYVALDVPLTSFTARATAAGKADTLLFEYKDTVGLPSSLVTAMCMGTPPDGVYILFNRTSHLTIGDWLATVGAVKGASLTNAAQVVQAQGLTDQLNGSGPLTVFAPMDGALQRQNVATLDSAVLNYHMVPGRYAPYELMKNNKLTTLHGGNLTFDFSGQNKSGLWEINGGAAIWFDVRLANGVLYVIDQVLLPR